MLLALCKIETTVVRSQRRRMRLFCTVRVHASRHTSVAAILIGAGDIDVSSADPAGRLADPPPAEQGSLGHLDSGDMGVTGPDTEVEGSEVSLKGLAAGCLVGEGTDDVVSGVGAQVCSGPSLMLLRTA